MCSIVIGESINSKFLRACAAEFLASFALVWMITCVSSGIGYLPITHDITNHHMLSTVAKYENYDGKFNQAPYTANIWSTQTTNNWYGTLAGGTFQRPVTGLTGKQAYQFFPQTNVMAFFGPSGGVLNALGFETGLNYGFDRTIGYSLVYGFAVAFLSYSVVDLSGAHINPIVSLALALSGNCTWLRAFFYWFFQFGGAIAGAGWLKLSVGPTYYLGGLLTRLPVEPAHGWLLEFWGSFFSLLPYLFFAPWSARSFELPWKLGATFPSTLGPLAAGLALFVASVAVHPFTGCAFNPARAVAAATFEQRRYTKPFAIFGFPQHWWIYWIGPIGAAVVVPLTYVAIVGTANNVAPFKLSRNVQDIYLVK